MNKLLLSFIMASCSFIPITWACDCDVPDLNKAVESSDVVFQGKVMGPINQTKSATDGIGFMFQASTVWKGPKEKEFVVWTPFGSKACGIHFEIGREYLVYARKMPSTKGLETRSCSRTQELTAGWSLFGPKRENDLAGLGKGENVG